MDQKTLVLTREELEEVVITTPDGSQITVGVGQVFPKRGGKSRCRLYFRAGEEVTINRKEIQDRINDGKNR